MKSFNNKDTSVDNKQIPDGFVDLDIKLPPIKKGTDPRSLRLISIADLKAIHKAIYNPTNNKEIIDSITIIESAIANNYIVK